jgi:hypothetical protein
VPHCLGITAETLGYWTLDAIENGKVADSGPQNVSGDVTGATVVTGKIGNALDFNGSAYVTLDSVKFQPADAVSLVAWAKPSAFAGGMRTRSPSPPPIWTTMAGRTSWSPIQNSTLYRAAQQLLSVEDGRGDRTPSVLNKRFEEVGRAIGPSQRFTQRGLRQTFNDLARAAQVEARRQAVGSKLGCTKEKTG